MDNSVGKTLFENGKIVQIIWFIIFWNEHYIDTFHSQRHRKKDEVTNKIECLCASLHVPSYFEMYANTQQHLILVVKARDTMFFRRIAKILPSKRHQQKCQGR